MTAASGIRRWVHPVDLALSLAILAFVGLFYYFSTQFEEVSPLSLIHISEPTRLRSISYAVFGL